MRNYKGTKNKYVQNALTLYTFLYISVQVPKYI